ncbi:ABC transporter ATP-binding protein [Gracilibacillus alcaliphilus]|uniref:ABC transporter ATP-binding protein n=1 Tax=Gracilibacillus alcaliphilus TaxID=1401441 RepID=UPI0019575BD9|nr:ATP-binding cassette domain-containing protein [Gracilibacillus alcaliphilus]MBM7676862.1 ABC-2 type transport system ATP-binding protein [Gracilibacillus alcaliphilus]
MSNAIIEVKQLSKQFKSNVAVNNVNFNIRKGDIFGLIGPNGAGKSTLLKMIGGLIYPSSGEIHLFDHTMRENHPYFERMGLLIEEAGIFPHYSAYKNLDLIAISYGIKNRKKHIEQLLELVGLDKSNKTKVKNYSMGMKQRLGIAMALIGSPDVLILDEPINGLDPQGISEIRQLILELNKTGITLIISSHILEELSKVATTYAILHHGKIIEIISKEELLLQCEDRIELEVDDPKMTVLILENHLGIQRYKVIDDHTIYVYETDIETQQIIQSLAENKIFVHSIAKHKQSLEQYFLERTGSSGGADD